MKVFDYVKPKAFLKKIIQIAPNLNEGDIILDFFSGSATTAHAVMESGKRVSLYNGSIACYFE